MPTARILFVIPEFAGSIVEAVEESGGQFEDVRDDADPSGYLSAHTGKATSVVFEDCNDPIDDVRGPITALKAAGVPYFAVTDSFVEPSRGLRAEGRVILNLDGSRNGENIADYPWRLGEPQFDETTMRNAGFAEQDVACMTHVFFKDVLAPARR